MNFQNSGNIHFDAKRQTAFSKDLLYPGQLVAFFQLTEIQEVVLYLALF